MRQDNPSVEQILYKHITSFQAVNYEETTKEINDHIAQREEALLKHIAFHFGLPADEVIKVANGE